MQTIKDLLIKYKELLLYGVVGCGTTAINWVVFYLCDDVIGMETIPAVAVAWVLSTLFSFIANKLWVFESLAKDGKTVRHEALSFFGTRLLTLLAEEALMYYMVDVLHRDHLLWKVISSIMVIILNYVAAKLLTFRKKKAHGGEDHA
ncbi:MAG: GtrA family protein [Oscillospiraceae bacterium]|nr:GtrA family protein [Oscillospiraceae bacterium]